MHISSISLLGMNGSPLKILIAMAGWDKFLDLLRIFGLLNWDATHLQTQNSPDLSQRLGSLVPTHYCAKIGHFVTAGFAVQSSDKLNRLSGGRQGREAKTFAALAFALPTPTSPEVRTRNPPLTKWMCLERARHVKKRVRSR